MGANDKMEMQKVPQAGYAIKGLWIAGIQRRLTFKNILFPLKLVVSMLKSLGILNAFKPAVVIGTGGFASGPLLQVAAMKGVPTLIQEQNSFPGITNKLLSKKVNKICVAYELDGARLDYLPTAADQQARCTPVYEEMPGWSDSTEGARSWAELPANAIKYVRRVEELIDCPVALLSTSPERDDTILVTDPFED